MNNKRFAASAAAAALLLAGILASCGEAAETPKTAENTPSGEEVTEAVTEYVDPRPALGLEDKDFGGKKYRISCYNPDDAASLFAESTNGEAVNDAVFERNKLLEEKYNFELYVEVTDENYDNQCKAIAKLVQAGDDAFELTYGHVVGSPNNAIAGYYVNLYDIPNLNFENPWWPQQSVKEMTVYNKMFTICSGINYRQLAEAKVIFFNKEMLTANDMEFPYQTVRDGKWTIDKLIAATKGLYHDLNGDGKADENDQFGYATYPQQNGFLVSCNTPVLSPTADGGREISVMTDRTVSLVEQVYSWYYESGDVFLTVDGNKDNKPYVGDVFGSGHAAFAFSKLNVANEHYRSDDISYGVVPQPKFDESQSDYYVFACPSLFSVPMSAQDLDFVGFIFEAMTYYGYYDVIPKFYEITVKGKIADSPDDAEMLSIINDNLTVSFAYCYDNWQGFAHLFNSRMGFTQTKGSKDLASVYQKNLKSATKRLETVLAGFAD